MDSTRRILITVTLSIIVCCIIGLIMQEQRKESLRAHRQLAEAIVSEYYSISFAYYYKYSFNVDGKIYTGSNRRNPQSDTPAIGDTVLIEYDALSPDNNTVIYPITSRVK